MSVNCNEKINVVDAKLIMCNFHTLYTKHHLTFKDNNYEEVEEEQKAKTIYYNFYQTHLSGECQTTYKTARGMKTGRLYATNSLQTIPRAIRHTLAKDLYYDFDIVNCHPNIIEQLCTALAITDIPTIRDYNANREERLQELMEETKKSRDEIKETIIKICYGCSQDFSWCEWLHKFYNEIHQVLDRAGSLFPEEFQMARKMRKKNACASALSYRCAIQERIYLDKMRTFCKKQKHEVGVLCHDGLMVSKLGIPDPVAFAAQLTSEINVKGIVIVHKPMDEAIDLSNYEEGEIVPPVSAPHEKKGTGYDAMKKEWEKTHFKIEHPLRYYELDEHDNSLLEWKDNEFQSAMCNRFCVDDKGEQQSFVQMWRLDENIRAYKKQVFDPSGGSPECYFNTYKGVAADLLTDLEYDEEVGDVGLQHFLELVDMVSNRNQEVKEYILNWLAQKIQTPHKRTQIVIILKGLGGSGKSTFADYVRALLAPHSSGTDKLSDISGNFNDIIKDKVYLAIDDPSGLNALKQIKSFVTGDVPQREKYKNVLDNVKSYVDMIVTVNSSEILSFDGGERRFMLVQSSGEQCSLVCKDKQFWKDKYKFLNYKDPCPHTLVAVTNFLRERDIVHFSPEIDRVISEEFMSEKRKRMRQEERFIKDFIDTKPDTDRVVISMKNMWSNYKKWTEDTREDHPLKYQSFKEKIRQISAMDNATGFNHMITDITSSSRPPEYRLDRKHINGYLVHHQYETPSSSFL